jgi:WD40 repeat protein
MQFFDAICCHDSGSRVSCVFKRLGVVATGMLLANCLIAGSACAAEIQVADVTHEGEVDFSSEILPLLRQNCLACHNRKDAESDLVLESVESILKGGAEGPAVVAGKPDESRLLILSAHREEPIMPPADNDVKAKPLSPEQLGLIKLWIAQGAKVGSGSAKVVKMEQLPAGINPVYALALSSDGRYVAAGRANQLYLYSVSDRAEQARLTDPALIEAGYYQNQGVAHLDLVQSIAFAPDNRTLASGDYKTVKIWQKNEQVAITKKWDSAQPIKSVALSPDQTLVAIGLENGEIEIRQAENGNVVKKLAGHQQAVTGVEFTADAKQLFSAGIDKTIRVWNVEEAKQVGESFNNAWPIQSLCLVANGTWLAISGENNAIDCYDIAKLTQYCTEAAKPAEPPKPEEAKPEDAKPADAKPEEAKPEEVKPLEAPKPEKSLAGHGAIVTKLVRAVDDGTQLLSASQDGTVRLWNVAGGNQLRQFAHGQPITDFAISPDRKTVATIGNSPSIKIWNADNGQMLAEMKGELYPRLAAEQATRNTTLKQRYWDLAKQDVEEQTKRKTSEEENAKKADEDLVKAKEDEKVKVEAAVVADKNKADADAELKTKQDELAAEEKNVATLVEQLAAADKLIAETKQAQQTATNTLNENKQKLTATQQQQTELQNQLNQKPDDAGLKDQVAKATEATTQAQQAVEAATKGLEAANKLVTDAEAAKNAKQTEKNQGDQKVNAVKQMVTAAENKVKSLEGPQKTANDQKTAAERAVMNGQRSVERSKLAVETATKAIPMLEAIAADHERRKQEADKQNEAAQAAANESEKPFTAISFQNNQTLIACSQNNRLSSWNVATQLASESYEFQACSQLQFTASGIIAIVAENKQLAWINPQVQWDLKLVIGGLEKMDFSDRVTSLAFNSDGTQLATGGGEPSRGGELKIWNVQTGALIREIPDAHSDTILGLSFSPDDKKIASSSTDRFIKVFDVASGQLANTYEGHTHHVMAIAWSADSRLLASAGADKVIKIWDAATAEQRLTIAGFNKEVTSIHFVGIQNQIIAASGDASVRLDEATSNRQIRRFGGFQDFVYCVGASDDGKVFAAGGHDGVVRVWKEDGNLLATFEQPKPDQVAKE